MPPRTTTPTIAIVHDFLTRLGGAERVVAELAALFPDAPIYTLLYDPAKVGAVFPPWRVRVSSLHAFPAFLRRRPKLLLPFFASAVEGWDFSDFDIVITSSTAWTQGIVTGTDTRQICYCHSPARFLWDYAHAYQRENRLTGWRQLFVAPLLKNLREWNRLSAHRVDRMLANSETVRGRIQKYYRREAEVVYPPVDTARVSFSATHEDYFLIVSQLTPYKKIDHAISVFNKLRRRLVIVGEGPQIDYLRAIAGPTIEIRGRESDATVAELLAYCRAFILPGEEDFGIAPVEAMAAGKPVIALARGGVTETVVDVVEIKSEKKKGRGLSPTGVLFSASSPAGLEAGLATFFQYESLFDPIKIQKHATQFSTTHFKKNIKNIVAEEWVRMHTT